MQAYKLIPTCKEYIWGGKKLKKEWNKVSDSDIIAESWELSCHDSGASLVADSGGVTLKELLAQHSEYLGTNVAKFDNFPILIKLIDSDSNLSIQVHPSDEYALKNEGQYGKTEMWYIVSAEKGSGVYCGFKSPLSREQVKASLDKGDICDYLNFIEVKAGDTLFIESGTVHAICGGLVICEVQQNSSLTYRLYDYNRLGVDGKPRELHIDKSLDVINSQSLVVKNSGVKAISSGYKRLSTCKYFTTYEITCDNFHDKVTENSFVALNFLSDGEIVYGESAMVVARGETVFLPAALGEYSIIGSDIRVIKTEI